MVNVYLSGADARNAAADLWQSDQLKRLNDQFAPPPADTAQPLPSAPVEAAGVQGSSLPSPPAVGPAMTQPAPPAAVPAPAPAPVLPAAPNPTPDRNDLADHFTRNAIADAWEQNALADVTKGVSQAGQGVQSALADVPKEAQGLVSNLSALPGATPPQPAQPAPGAISGIPAPQPTQGQIATVAGGGGTDVEQYIRQSAAAHGIEPDTAVRVAQSEGGLTNPVRQSDYVDPSTGQREQSFGPFQLYLGGGLGNAALKAGIDPRDPNQWRQAVDFALDQAARGGWSPWHGAARAGIGNFEGIGQAVGGGQQAASADTQPISRPADDWLAIAKEQLGKPYIWGSAGGRSTFDPSAPGFDCSGFVSYVMKKAFGVDLPAFTGTAYTATRPLQEGETPGAAGQVAFYNMGQSDPHLQHIALSIGDGKVIQAGGRRNDVNTDVANDIGTPEWRVPVGIPGKLADAAQQVVGAGAAAAQTGQNVQQAVQQTAQGLIGAVGNIGSTIGTAAGNVGGALNSPNLPGQIYQNSPIGAFNAGLQGVGQNVVSPAIGAITQPGGPLVGPRTAAAGVLENAASNVPPGVPVVAGALQHAAGMVGGPTVIDQIGMVQDLANKYPSNVPGLPDVNRMTPQDQAQWSNLMIGVGGIVGGEGAGGESLAPKAGNLEAQARPPAQQFTAEGAEVPPSAGMPPQSPTAGAPPVPGTPTTSPAGPSATAAPAVTSPMTAPTGGIPAAGAGVAPATAAPAAGLGGGGGAAPPIPPAAAVGPGAVPAPVPTGPLGNATPWDILRTARVGSLAGGIPTVTHIALNTPLQAGWKLFTNTAQDVLTGHPEAVPMQFVGAWQGLRNWSMNASQTLTQPGVLAQKMGGGAGAQAVETGLLGLVKTHPLLQDLSGQLGANMELWRSAAKGATDAGLTRFSGPWQAEVQRLVSNPTPEMQTAVQRAQDIASLRGPMGFQGQKVADWLQNNELGRFILPFFNIGYHVAAQGIERSPAGFIGTAYDVARSKLGAGPYAAGAVDKAVTPLAERFYNNLVGTGLFMEAYSQAAQGNITGNGPDDPAQRAELMSQGWMPNSTLVGGRWVDNHVLGPAGWALAEAANLAEARGDTPYTRGTKAAEQRQDGMQQAANYLTRMGTYLQDETFLRSFGQLLQAASSGAQAGRMGESVAASVAGSLVPQGALIANVASAQDPYARRAQPGNIAESLMARLPGQREQVPVRMNALGEPEQNPQYGAGILLPRSGTGQPSPVLTLLAGAGITLPATPPKDINYSGRQLTLSPDEQQLRQQVLGQRLTQTTQGYVNSTKFQALQPDQQKRALEPLVRAAEQYADQRVVAAMTPEDRRARLATAPRTGAYAPVYPAAGSGLASIVARQSAADADAAHQRLLAQNAGQPVQPQLAGVGP